MASNVLNDRDINAQIKPTPSPLASKEKEMPKSLDYHRQILASRMKEEQPPQYISPSDEIMSPASQKLTAFRGKHAMKKSKPQTLFKKTSSKNFEASKGGLMFADVPKDVPLEEDSKPEETQA